VRQVVLDTETTGLDVGDGHRIIEIGCVELVHRRLTGRRFHRYVNPRRDIDAGAIEVHGITSAFLADKPEFALIADELIEFLDGAELVIHNAPFDLGFLDAELRGASRQTAPLAERHRIVDTLLMARHKHPGQRNNLDALCQRYGVDNSQRDLHGALLDAEILADVYLAMTGGQTDLALSVDVSEPGMQAATGETLMRAVPRRRQLVVLPAGDDELAAHEALLDHIAEAAGGRLVWRE